MNDSKILAHTKWNCKYHVVFAPKYRRKIFYAEQREIMGQDGIHCAPQIAPSAGRGDKWGALFLFILSGAVFICHSERNEVESKNPFGYCLHWGSFDGALTGVVCVKGIEIIERKMAIAHVHLLLPIPPKFSILGVMGYLKAKSSLIIYQKFV